MPFFRSLILRKPGALHLGMVVPQRGLLSQAVGQALLGSLVIINSVVPVGCSQAALVVHQLPKGFIRLGLSPGPHPFLAMLGEGAPEMIQLSEASSFSRLVLRSGSDKERLSKNVSRRKADENWVVFINRRGKKLSSGVPRVLVSIQLNITVSTSTWSFMIVTICL